MNTGLKVDLNCLPVINYPMHQCHVPVVREITVRNTGLYNTISDIDVIVSLEPGIAPEHTVHIDSLDPGAEEKITGIPLAISPEFLINVNDQVPARVAVTVRSAGQVLYETDRAISILAFDEWGGTAVTPELIAAFSTPGNPVVGLIRKRAEEIIERWTGNPLLNAYQDRDHNRVKLQMAAIFEAISEKAIISCPSPADFISQGQRIRTAEELTSMRMGNSLDMTMLYVGCLESVGLHPLVILTEGQALAGCWLIPDSFADSSNDDPSLITKRMAAGINEILAVDCTAMNEGSTQSFDDACAAAKQTMLTIENFHIFIDVCRARVANIRPIPSRMMDASGKYVIDETVTARDTEAPTEMSATDLVIDKQAEVSKKIIWERKLLDLTLRNNLLNLRMTKGTIPFIASNINAFEDALANNEDFRVSPKPADWDCEILSDGTYKPVSANDPIHALLQQELKQNRIRTYLEDEPLKKSLTHLYRSAKTSMEENGANTLYLALGLLKWYETPTSQKPRYAPILLVPVEIVRKSAATGYVIRSRDEETMLNITLLELLRQMFDINIGGLDPLPRDESGIDTSLVFNTIRRKILEQTRWDVVEQAILGNFSFSKFIMWNDIHNNSDILCESPIVSSLMNGVVDESINAVFEDDGDLDEKFRTEDIILPISADSSQIEAISGALTGRSFILHGPPGTGKSQTITNIIANALYRGKKVLFVAEKMAALEVVQNRLNAIGLGPFCLELHSNKAKKSNVLEQLKKTTEVVKTKSPEDYRREAESINKVRDEMNTFIKSLHKEYPVGLSLYDCIARYVSIDEGCQCFDLRPTDVKALTKDVLDQVETAISELRTAISIIGDPSANPLKGIGCLEYNAEIENTLASLDEIVAIVSSMDRKLSVLHKHLLGTNALVIPKDAYDLLISLSQALDVNDIHAGILFESEDEADAVKELIAHGRKRDMLKKEFDGFDDNILEIDVKAFEKEWREALSKGFIIKYLAVRKFLRKLVTYCDNPVKEADVIGLLKKVAEFQKEENAVSRSCKDNDFIMTVVSGYETDWDKVERTCKFYQDVKAIIRRYTSDKINQDSISTNIVDFLRNEDRQLLRDILSERGVLRERLSKALNVLGGEMTDPDDNFISSTRNTLTRWYDGRDKIRSWVLFNKMKDNLKRLGLERMVGQIDSGTFAPDVITDAFHKGLYKAYAEYILTQEPDLQLFHGVMFEEKIRRFRDLCKDFERLTKEELFARVASNLPALQKEASLTSEVGILQRNIRNGCRGTSLRNFFSSIPDLLHRMCPCMLMSPISVAQYIEADGMKFDLVIFDEASQMPTCEAVGTIARGKSIIVVGDPKQLPPTTFFHSNTFDEDNSHLEDLESILDDCLALSLPSKHLIWHYRSRHESLIAFSNSKYYDNKLHTFPSPDDLQTKIGYQHVVGIYDRGGTRQNRAEADAIIAEIKRRLEDPVLSKLSIGVVTFNSNQQSLLEDLLNDLFIKYPHLEKVALECEEPIFIKNLENVQGDERDVILFSIGYGQDKYGKVTLNFGPLNRDGGWRRLNVAVSRARYEMKVFSTLTSDQIDLRRTSAEGVVGLKEFLEYAEKGQSNHAVENRHAASHDGFVEVVAKAVRDRGYEVRTNIGSSGYKLDIGVVNPDDDSTYVLGILCDGYNFASSRSARDREIVQIGVLDSLGWNIHRIWVLDWWIDKDAVIAGIISMIEKAIADLRLKPEVKASDPDTDQGTMDCKILNTTSLSRLETAYAAPIPSASVEEAEQEYLVPYVITPLKPSPLSSEELVNGRYDVMITGIIRQIIETEAPITKDLLCKRVLKAINISRMGTRVAGYMDSILRSMNLKQTVDVCEVYWREDQDPESYPFIRYSKERDATHITFEEAKNAAVHVLRQQGAQPADSLIREMGKLFGYSRIGDNVYAAMLYGVELAIKRSLIDSTPGRLSLKQ